MCGPPHPGALPGHTCDILTVLSVYPVKKSPGRAPGTYTQNSLLPTRPRWLPQTLTIASPTAQVTCVWIPRPWGSPRVHLMIFCSTTLRNNLTCVCVCMCVCECVCRRRLRMCTQKLPFHTSPRYPHPNISIASPTAQVTCVWTPPPWGIAWAHL